MKREGLCNRGKFPGAMKGAMQLKIGNLHSCFAWTPSPISHWISATNNNLGRFARKAVPQKVDRFVRRNKVRWPQKVRDRDDVLLHAKRLSLRKSDFWTVCCNIFLLKVVLTVMLVPFVRDLAKWLAHAVWRSNDFHEVDKRRHAASIPTCWQLNVFATMHTGRVYQFNIWYRMCRGKWPGVGR